MKVLLVDDDLVSVSVIKSVLKSAHEISVETSGAQAIIRTIEEQPELILLDLHMPNIDGFEVLRQLKQHPVTAAIPIVCMSGDEQQESRDRAGALGSIGYLQKPLQIANLKSDLDALIDSLNINLVSPSAANHFTIAFNHNEKYRLLEKKIKQTISEGHAVLVLSLLEGTEFCGGHLLPQIESEQVIYLRIVPSLIAKLPFMMDLSPLISDIQSLIQSDLRKFPLFMDDPHLILGYEDSLNLTARIHALKKELIANFNTISIFCCREQSQTLRELISTFARVMCG